jgi:hypothetical protein
VNVTGSETLSVRTLAESFGRAFSKPVRFKGSERTKALLSSTEKMRAAFSAPEVTVDKMIEWVGEWIRDGGRLFGKPTHFEDRTGTF